MIVLVVVPQKERLGPGSRIGEGAKALREIRPILEGLEVGLGIGVIIRRIGTGMGLGHTQIGQQQGHRLRAHRAAAVGVQGQLTRRDALFSTRLLDEGFRQPGCLAFGD